MRALFIVNPAAGNGRGRARWEAARRALLESGLPFEARMTESPGHAGTLAAKGLEEGFEAVVAVGGDGTLGEIVDGVLSRPAGARAGVLATWPVGSGCDFARHMGLRADPEALVESLRRPEIRALDAGQVEFRGPDGETVRRRFLNVTSLGIAGEVALRVQRGGKPFGGTVSYLLSSLGAVLSARPYDMDLIVDGQARSGRYHLIAMANTRTTGGGMNIAPQADPEDGRLDFVAVEGLCRWELLKRFPLIYTGGHVGTPGVHYSRVSRLEVRSPQTVTLNIDGEAIGTLPAVFEILPKAVPFLCGPKRG